MGKKDIMRELREDAEAWRKEQTLEAYIGILETIFNGLRENALIHVPFVELRSTTKKASSSAITSACTRLTALLSIL